MSISCTREQKQKHMMYYWFLLDNMVVQKIGQYPSLADIANDEGKDLPQADAGRHGIRVPQGGRSRGAWCWGRVVRLLAANF
jgi:hypothetical protein